MLSQLTTQIQWGDGTTASTGSPTLAGDTLSVSGSHTYAAPGSDTFVVEILWNSQVVATASNAATVDAPILTGTSMTIPVSLGTSFQGAVAAFSDVNTTSLSSDFTATINWGDGSAPTAGVVLGSSGSFSVAGNHTYTAAGATFPVTVTVDDSEGDSVTIDSTAQPSGSALSVSGVSLTASTGLTLSATVASFTQAVPDPSETFTATIAWGDGATSDGTITASTTDPGTYAISGQHAYTSYNPATIVVTLSASDGTTYTVDSAIAFATASSGTSGGSETGGVTFQDYAIVPAVGVEFNNAVATFQDSSTSNPSDFTATINWGDGTQSAGVVTGDGSGSFTVTGDHTFTEDPVVSVDVSGPDGAGFSSSQPVAVGPTAPVISTQPLEEAFQEPWVSTLEFQGTVATFTATSPTTVPGDYTATINWGDGSDPVAASVTGNASAGFTIQTDWWEFSHAGTFDVTVTVNGPDDTISVAHAMIDVIDPPVTAGLSAFANGAYTNTVTAGVLSDFQGDFTTASDQSASDFVAQINWGDGTTTTAELAPDGEDHEVGISANHNYANPGAYLVTLTLTDDEGESSTSQSAINVTSPTDVAAIRNVLVPGPIPSLSSQQMLAIEENPVPLTLTVNWGDGTPPSTLANVWESPVLSNSYRLTIIMKTRQ